jgi:hypothetical protein
MEGEVLLPSFRQMAQYAKYMTLSSPNVVLLEPVVVAVPQISQHLIAYLFDVVVVIAAQPYMAF